MVKPVYLMGSALTAEASTDVITAYRTTRQKLISEILAKLSSLFIFNVLLAELSCDRHVRVREHEQAAILGNAASFFPRVSRAVYAGGRNEGRLSRTSLIGQGGNASAEWQHDTPGPTIVKHEWGRSG